MRLVILGAGGHGQTVADIAYQTGLYDEICFLDDNLKENSIFLIVGKCSDYMKYKSSDTEMYPAFGNNAARVEWENRLISEGINLALIIHSTAYISPTAKIEKGSVIMPYAIINTGVTVEKACIINVGAIVDHGNYLEEGCHVAPGGIVKAENRIPRYTKIDSGDVVQIRTYPL